MNFIYDRFYLFNSFFILIVFKTNSVYQKKKKKQILEIQNQYILVSLHVLKIEIYFNIYF